METRVIMSRNLFGGVVRQDSKNSYLSANDVLMIGNVARYKEGKTGFSLGQWLISTGTQELITEIENETGVPAKVTKRGKYGGTFLHPILFVDLALSISPALKLVVYRWIADELIQYRNKSGDTYKMMAGALWLITPNKSKFKDIISEASNMIKAACMVENWNTATEKQLKTRNIIQFTVSSFTEYIKDPIDAVKAGINAVFEKDGTPKEIL